ncbi:MAG TPA: serine/threonine-protein kinase [Drouetiella sp.]
MSKSELPQPIDADKVDTTATDIARVDIAKVGADSLEDFRFEYKPDIAKYLSFAAKVTSPVAFFAIVNAFNSAYLICTGHIVPANFAGFVTAIFFLSIFYFLIDCSANTHFVLRRWGITFPYMFRFAAPFKLSWTWNQLIAVMFSRSNSDVSWPDQITFRFEGEKKPVDITIKITEINQLDLKKMIYSIATNASHVQFEPPLETVALEFPTVTGIKHLNFSNFTTMWDEEFSTRYSPTLFVPLQPEQQLRSGGIIIKELIACGGSAAIYSAKDHSGAQIIVKEAVIPKNSSEALRTKAIELFNREALLLTQLNHPNIAKVYDHFVENEHHYEVLEYIDGLDLRRFVKERGPQPEDFVLNWAEQICEILIYLHSQNPPVIHRDLTPDNLVLRVDGKLVLIDFGAANAFVGTATGTMVGKQSYMPIEQLRGKSVPQSDIFSLGGTIYFLLTGEDPRPLEPSQVKNNSNISTKLNPFLARCTAVEVADRFRSSTEVLDQLRAIRRHNAMAQQ